LSAEKWNVTFMVSRQKGQDPRRLQAFKLEVDPDEYVLDGVERIWAFHDRSLVYRHACHHSTCGACGMLVNGVEKLTCITTIRAVTGDGGTIKVEPLRNFPVVSDLSVNMSQLYARLEDAGASQVAAVEDACLPYEKKSLGRQDGKYERLVDCIECGLCISACPSALTSSSYFGPGVIAAAEQNYLKTKNPDLLQLMDSHDGAWGCHAVYECSEVCPSNVDPGWRIMDMRRKIIGQRVSQFFKK
jgi:succinate dehydrogenase / fumarate reductase, iron-sulfur subunit